LLESWSRKAKTEQRLALRAKIILSAASGLSGQGIAEQLRTRPARISKWLGRFSRERIAGLADQPRSGTRQRKYSRQTAERILQALDRAAPQGYSRWNGRLLAEQLGDVSKDQVWRVLRHHRIQLARRKSWCVSTDPEFSRKAADVVGLYLNPPQHNAVVLCVDEKPHIQALERAQGWIRLPDGRARYHHSVCGPGSCHRLSPGDSFPAPAAARVPGFHERVSGQLSRPRNPCRAR
jgi:transposase